MMILREKEKGPLRNSVTRQKSVTETGCVGSREGFSKDVKEVKIPVVRMVFHVPSSLDTS